MKVTARLLVSALGFSVGLGLAPAALAHALEIRWTLGPAGGGPTADNGHAGKALYLAKGGGGGGGGGGAGGGGAGGAGGTGGAGGGGGAAGGAGGAGGAGAAGGAGSGAGAGAAGSGGAGGAGASGGGAAAGGGSGAGAASGGAAAGAGPGAGPAGGPGGAGTAGAGTGGPAGGFSDPPGSGNPGSLGGADALAILDLARADLAAGAFIQAQARAESVLRASVPARVRATALVLAGDAAYGLGAYRRAADCYGEALQADQLPAEAAHTGFALGWAALHLGRREQAWHTWMQVSQQFPADPGAPIALIQAAEVAAQAGELVVARTLLDRVLADYSTSSEAEIARLSRSVVAMREGRTQEAVRDLRALAHSSRPSLARERRMLLDGLPAAGSQAGPEPQLLLTIRYEDGPGRAAGDESDTPPADTAGAFARFVAPFLGGAGDSETTPHVLHGLVFAAAEDKAWSEVQTLSSWLVDRFPRYPSTPDVLVWVADLATSAQQWPIVRDCDEHLLALNRNGALTPEAQLNFAEALFRTGATAQARVRLSRFLEVTPRAEDAPRALHLLAEVNEALDQPGEALAAYKRLRRDYPRAKWTAESLLPHARLLQHTVGTEEEARAVLEDAVQQTQGEAHREASFRLAQLLAANGQHEQAGDRYMSVAFGTEQSSRWYRPALLGAARSLAASGRTLAAEAVYHILLPSASLGPLPRDGRPVARLMEKVEEPALAAEAAYGLADLLRGSGRNAEAVDMYLTAASFAPESELAWRGLVGAIRSLVAISDWKSVAAIYERLVESHRDAPEILAEARNALGPPRRDASTRGR
jgi:tetratricopeptide (TPR) repeat protein